jgi:NAD(P)-dependent dehydrogenase (short-subunit alcohol dehydrogenase family)
MRKIIITGYNSNIAKNLIKILKKSEDIEIIKAGRCKDADIFVEFNCFDSVKKFAQTLQEKPFSHLLICHGVLYGEKIDNLNKTECIGSVFVNMTSVIFLLEQLTNLKNINTLVVSSISGKKGSYDNLYASCKAGVDLAVKTISKQLDSSSRLNALAPGIISDTRMTMERKDKENLQNILDTIPTRQFSTSLEVAELGYYILFKSSNLNSSIIDINGGHY